MPMRAHLSRRTFLATSAALPAALASAVGLGRPRAPVDRLGEPATGAMGSLNAPQRAAEGARLKLSLNAYSFVEMLDANAKDATKGIDLFGVCDFCAKHGFDAVDATGYFFPGYPNAPADAYLVKLKRHVFDLGLELSGTGVRNDFTTADAKVRAEGVQRVKTWIEVAAKLGAPTVRAFAESQAPFRNWRDASANAPRETVERWAAEALHECAEHGERYGVIVAVQNHADFITTGAEHVSLLRRVSHPWCRAMVDTGSYLTDDPYVDIALAAPWAVNWQVKETTRSRLDSPRLDLTRFVRIARRTGYRGYLPIETLRMGRADYDSFVEIPRMLDRLRAAIAETERG
jgi:sugar phosphate isomerase/epimerase